MRTDTASRLYRFTFVLILTLAALGAFLFIVQDFVLDIALAAILAGIIDPLFRRSLPLFRGWRGLAAAVAVVAAILSVLLPLVAIIALVGSDAVQMSEAAMAWVARAVANPEVVRSQLPDWFVQAKWLDAALAAVGAHAADIVGAVAGFLSRNVSSVTQGTLRFFLDFAIVAFALAHFLNNGPKLVEHLIHRIPVARSEAHAIVDRTLSTTAATLKSIVVIGAAEGFMFGTAVALVGIGHPWFWGGVAAITSTIPAVGSTVVWIPAAVYLLLSSQAAAAVAFSFLSVVVVTMIDNAIRIAIVGRGATIPGFLVFISTLGGLMVLGAPGLLIGPVVTAVLIGVLDVYHAVLKSSGLSGEAEPAVIDLDRSA
jgi:predicted PurR-regulated permease PerM